MISFDNEGVGAPQFPVHFMYLFLAFGFVFFFWKASEQANYCA